jgi:hypothetical protein
MSTPARAPAVKRLSAHRAAVVAEDGTVLATVNTRGDRPMSAQTEAALVALVEAARAHFFAERREPSPA